MKTNKGIIIQGGELSSNQMSVGDNAKIINKSSLKKDELLNHFERVIKLLEEEKHSIKNYSDIKKAIETAQIESEKDKPDKNTLNTILSMIANNVSSFTKVYNAIKELIAIII